MREGQTKKVGSMKITDGQSPKDLRLNGLNSASDHIEGTCEKQTGLLFVKRWTPRSRA